MAESLLASLLHTLDPRTVGDLAGALGCSPQSVTRGAEASMASVLGGLASQSQDPGLLRRIFDLTPSAAGDISWSHMVSAIGSADSPLIAGGKRILSSLFGTNENTVINAIGGEGGIGTGPAATLLAIAAPVVTGFLQRRVRDEGMSMSTLGNLLQRESATIRAALPAGVSDLLWPRAAAAPATGAPVIAQTATRQRSSSGWVPALVLAALALGVFWLFNHARRPEMTGMANRVGTAPNLGPFVKRTLPNHMILNIPANGVEARLLTFIQDPNAKVDQTTWFDFDRLVFDTGSANLQPESKEQLDNVSAILTAYPNVNMKIGGYTDNVGSPDRNLHLSQARADAVKAELVRRGIASERLTTEGYGEQHAVASNDTEQGRAQNRRVSMRVTQK
jgi:OmpA-OmpF porin, OOP family